MAVIYLVKCHLLIQLVLFLHLLHVGIVSCIQVIHGYLTFMLQWIAIILAFIRSISMLETPPL